MFCRQCGAQNEDSYQNCANCGAPLRKVEANQQPTPNQPVTPPPTAQQDYSQQSAQQTYTQPTGSAGYTQTINVQAGEQPSEREVSVAQWVGIFCINLIPCVGSLVYIIMMFVWAFGSTPKQSLKNFARAQLIIIGIVIVLVMILTIIMAAVGANLWNEIRWNLRGW